jgi:hypothetical protein
MKWIVEGSSIVMTLDRVIEPSRRRVYLSIRYPTYIISGVSAEAGNLGGGFFIEASWFISEIVSRLDMI